MTKQIEDAIEAQANEDAKYGALDLVECNTIGIDFSPFAGKVSAAQEHRLVAIASLINELCNEVEMISHDVGCRVV